MLPQNDVDIYDGESIDGSFEAKNKNNWVQIFDMIDLTFNNLQQQNKELKRTVNELSSKVNKVRYFNCAALMKTFDFLYLRWYFMKERKKAKTPKRQSPRKPRVRSLQNTIKVRSRQVSFHTQMSNDRFEITMRAITE